MKKTIVLLPGDGVGPEIIDSTFKILKIIEKKYKHNFLYQKGIIGSKSIIKHNTPLPIETIEICKKSDAIILGAVGDPKFDKSTIRPEQGLLDLRKKMSLYCNIRPIKYYESIHNKSPIKKKYIKNSDFIIYRELISGMYFGHKKTYIKNQKIYSQDICEYSETEIERIAIQAFECARKRKKKVTLIDKANVLETSKLWRKIVTKIKHNNYPDITLNYMLVDNAAMQIIINPKQFDVILTENMFGDILSDEASLITGSIGLLPSASIGYKTAIFEPIHGSYPEAKGKDIANPIGAILSLSMMLKYFGLINESLDIKNAVENSIKYKISTIDINQKNPVGTKNLTTYLSNYISNN